MPSLRGLTPMSPVSACSAQVGPGPGQPTGAGRHALETGLKPHSNTVVTTSFADRRG